LAEVAVAQLYTKAESLAINSVGHRPTSGMRIVSLSPARAQSFRFQAFSLTNGTDARFRRAMPYAIDFAPFRGCATDTSANGNRCY